MSFTTPGSNSLDTQPVRRSSAAATRRDESKATAPNATGAGPNRLAKVMSGIVPQRGMSIVTSPVAPPAPPPVVVQASSLPRHTQEQLLSLYLKYDGVSVDKIPNLVADLNLSIPVDFNIDKYFRNEFGSKQLILQPQDLCHFVEDLQKVVGHPNDSVLDTCQVLAANSGPSVSPASVLDRSMSMTYAGGGGDASRSLNSAEWSRNNKTTTGEPDYVERAAIEATLEQFFPPEVNISDVMSHTVFRRPAPPSSLGVGGGERRASGARNAQHLVAAKKQPLVQRQSLEQFRSFLVSDTNAQRMEDTFRRCGATDEGYGLVLTAATLERVCQDRQRSSCNEASSHASLFATIEPMLDPHQTGDIELPSFEAVVLQQLQQASTMAAKAAGDANANVQGLKVGGVVASLLASDVSSSSTSDVSSPPPVALLVASLAPAAVLAFTNRQTLDWLLRSRAAPSGGSNARGGPSSSAVAKHAAAGKGPSNAGGQGSPNLLGLSQADAGGSNRYPLDQQSTPLTSATIDEMLTGIKKVRGGSERNTALPRYMLRGPDDEITASVKLRARQRKEADAQRAQSARTERHGFGLRLAMVTSASTKQQQQRRMLLAPRLPDELDIDAVLQSKPVPRPPASVDRRQQPATSRLSQPKGYALLRAQRAPHEALSSATSSAVERFMINYDKDTPRGNDVTPIIENALSAPYAGGPPPHKISPRMAVLLADPYSVPPLRLHSAHEVHYVYRRDVDSWRVSPKRDHRQQHREAGCCSSSEQ